jgi:hypothetical protein
MVSSSTIPEGTWHTRGHLAYQGAPGKPRKENTERGWSFLEFMKAAPLIVKLLLAIFGGGITITVVIVIGANISPPSPPSHIYSTAIRQGWLNDCEGRSFNSPSKCECELSYFEQDYGAMPRELCHRSFLGRRTALTDSL